MNLLRFFFSPLDPNCEAVVSDEAARRRLMLPGNVCLLVGPVPAVGLCWAFCHSVAAEGDTAYVVCGKKRLERNGVGPPLTPGSVASSAVWQRVALKYVESAHEAARVLLSLHELNPPPRVVVVDVDWAALLPSGHKTESARLIGLLMSALLDATRRTCCIVTCAANDAAVEPLLRRYIGNVVSLSNHGAFNVLQVEGSAEHAKIKFALSQSNVLSIHSVV